MKPKPLFPRAHVVTKISPGARAVDSTIDEWHEPHGTLQSVVHQDPGVPGVMLHARLGASGLQLIRNDVAVCIPLEVLFDLAHEINPKFKAPLDRQAGPAPIVEQAGAAPIEAES